MSSFSYTPSGMSFKERGTWVELLTMVGVFAWYATVILERAGGGPLADVTFRGPMIRAVIISIVLTIVLHIIVAMLNPKDANEEDVRDREIGRFGDYVGMWPLVACAIGALILSIEELDHFWIANVLYVGFFLSAATGAVAKLIAYRFGLRRD